MSEEKTPHLSDAAIGAWIENHPREFAAWVDTQRSIGGPAPACPNCDGSGTWRVPYADSVGEAKLACPHPVHEAQARFGQVAYAAFRKAITDASPSPHTPYEDLPPANRGAFVAAADAVAVLATCITGRKLAIALDTLREMQQNGDEAASEALAQIADVDL